MKKTPIVAGTVLGLAASLALGPSAAAAARFHGGAVGGRVIVGGRPFVSHPFVARPFVAHPFVARPFVAHPFVARPFFPHRFVRPFVAFAVVVPPVVAFASPPVVYSAPAYSDSSMYAVPPVAYGGSVGGAVSVAPAPQPMPTVVEFPTGRYELRGDGTTTPYKWVWIPNPPSAPPTTEPPAGAPAPGSPSPGPQG